MSRVLSVSMVVLLAGGLLLACGGGGEKTAPPIVLPPKDTVKPKPDVVVAEAETGPELPPVLSILGIVGLDEYPTLFCGGNIRVLVGAENIGTRKLRLFIPKNDTDTAGPVLGVEPALENGSSDRYVFTLNGSALAAPAEGDPLPGQANLVDGKKFLLGLAAFESVEDSDGKVTLSYPSDPELRTQREFIYDNSAPQLKVTAPNLGKTTPTMSGLQPITGTVTDNMQVGRFEAYFNGELVLEIEHTAEQIKTQPIDSALDLRDELTAAADLELRAYDACGQSTTLTAEVKVIAHPFLRQFARTLLPPKTTINDAEIVDWNDDTYPDLIFATTQGVVLALNDGVDGPGQFSDIRSLTNRQATQVAVADLDADGDFDVVAIQSVASIGNAVAVHRQLPGGTLLLTESHALPISSGTVIRDLIVADFTNDPPDTRRGDIALITSGQSESIILFKRQRADQPAFSDQCDEVVIPSGDAGPDADGGAEVSADALAVPGSSTGYVCKELFSPATKAGGIEDLITAEVVDLTGDQGEPDGFLDLVVASESHNQINVFANRFFETNLLDTAFSQATVSFVWPVPSSNAQDVKYFCTGNFIEEPGPGPDRLDIVAGTESSGTWRVLRNIGDGKFQNSKGANDPYEIWNMSGATNATIKGLVCGDFDLDGHEDFAILSQAAQILEVHLGNGQGRFNQVGDPDVLADQLQNPVNEGVGFTTGSQAQNLKLADFDQDGLLDFYMDFRDAGFGIFRNRTAPEQGFDLEATRVLLTPLGKQGSSTGGQIQKFTIADLHGDPKPEIIAFSSTRTYPTASWLRDYHPMGQLYRNFLLKGASSPTMFVWTQGHYGPDEPSWPAAYDRFPAIVYPLAPQYAGPVTVNQIEVMDLVSPGGEVKPDGKRDVLIVGGSAGTPQSVATLYINTSSAKGFWDPVGFGQTAGSMFSPYNGGATSPTAIQSFSMVPPPSGVIPTFVIGTDAGFAQSCDAPVPPMLRTCAWNPAKLCHPLKEEICPFWQCWEPNICPQDSVGKEFGGQALAMSKVATEGPKKGQVDTSPLVKGDVMVLSGSSDSMTTYRWEKPDPVFPFGPPTTSSVGDNPRQFDVKDINNDGLLDFAASVSGNVMLAFGRPGLNPFESPLAVEPGVEQKGGADGVVLSDVNSDGFLDVVFVEAGRSQISIYLAAGTDPNQAYLRQFHGPVIIPVCRQPSDIMAYDFNGDGCETLLVLCGSVGAIASITNDTCARRAAGL
ncbi:MAG: VCBS repeat-containing protein [Myxococcota bacterium]